MSKTILLLKVSIVLTALIGTQNAKAADGMEELLKIKVTSANDPTRPVPGGVHWFGRDHGRNMEKTRQANFKLCFLGDSITQMWHGDLFNKNFGKHNPANFGSGGDRAENVLWRLDHVELAGTFPKLIVIQLGTNNSGMNEGPEIALGVATVIKKLREVVPKTKILLLAIFPSQNPVNRARIDEANKYLAKLDDGKMIRFLDLNANFLGDDGKLRQDMFNDAVHLSRLGYAMWGATTHKIVSEMMGE